MNAQAPIVDCPSLWRASLLPDYVFTPLVEELTPAPDPGLHHDIDREISARRAQPAGDGADVVGRGEWNVDRHFVK